MHARLCSRCRKGSISFGIRREICYAVGNSRWMFKVSNSKNPQDPIQRHYLSTLVFSRSCAAEMWRALVRSVCLCANVRCRVHMPGLTGLTEWAKGPRCGCCARKEVVGD